MSFRAILVAIPSLQLATFFWLAVQRKPRVLGAAMLFP
jgi:hypothetical protein